MVRHCLRIGNVVLFALCCFLLAEIANEVSAGLLQSSRVELALSPVVAPAAAAPSWREREWILDRNLFGSSLVAASIPEPEPEELEKTALPLELAGTLASEARGPRMASIWNQESREYQVLRPGDRLEDHPEVELARVERGRVVLRNGDELEELLLADREHRFSRTQRRAEIREARRARVQEMRRAVRAARKR